MKTLYVNDGSNITIDTENNMADRLYPARLAISRIYMIKEPMHIVYGDGETHCEADAEAGDIVIVFYEPTFKNPVVTIKNKEWAENIVEYEKKEQEEKERWAQGKLSDCERCGDCPQSESIGR